MESELNMQLLYFTSPSISADGEDLFFIGEKDGHPNLYCMNLKDKKICQLTENQYGELKSYVYFWGDETKGLGKASVSLDAERKILYYIQDNCIYKTDMQGNRRYLNRIPDQEVTAFTHVSKDGKYLCVPTSDARTLEFTEQEKMERNIGYDIDLRVQEENLKSYIRIYDTGTGQLLKEETVQRAWVTHVQFSPVNPEMILYNHEWCHDSGIRRMWIWDGKKHYPLRQESQERKKEDWTCHEMWESDGTHIIYHGKYENGISYIGRVNPDGTDVREIPLPDTYQQYGHFTVANCRKNLLVSDGYYTEDADDTFWAGRIISIQKVDWEKSKLQWIPLCYHGSGWSSQDCHPHPVFDGKDEKVYFTSDMDGKRKIYYVFVEGENKLLDSGYEI